MADPTKELAKAEIGLARPPDRVISEARIAVNVFKGVIEQKPRKVIINKEQYLEYEDWQTLGEFYRCSAITRDAVPIEVDGVKGAKAHADLVNIDTGLIIGGAEAYCLRDEENWRDKPWFQLASMAQTRAGAKAFRNRLAWVAVMAGYRPTPAEEMESQRAAKAEDEHWCPEHNCAFREFRKDGNHWYSHKNADGTWCNEDRQPKAETETPNGHVAVPVKGDVKTEATLSKVTPPVDLGIDMKWLEDSFAKIKWTKDATWKSWLKSKANYTNLDLAGDILEVIARMTKEQKEFFVHEIQQRAEMA